MLHIENNNIYLKLSNITTYFYYGGDLSIFYIDNKIYNFIKNKCYYAVQKSGYYGEGNSYEILPCEIKSDIAFDKKSEYVEKCIIGTIGVLYREFLCFPYDKKLLAKLKLIL